MSDKKTIMALHGAGLHGGIWGGMAPRLMDFDFTAPSLPGHNPDLGGAPLADIPAMAAWYRARLDRHERGSVVLCGHSMGGLIALLLGGHPAVCGAVFLASAARMPVNDDLLAQAKDDPVQAAGLVLKWGVFPEHPHVADIRRIVRDVQAEVDPAALYADLFACNGFDGAEHAAAFEKPALVIASVDDKMVVPESSMNMAGLMPDSARGALAGCGHMFIVEKPDEVSSMIKTFAAGLVLPD